jgi:propionyl-CoA synthetase
VNTCYNALDLHIDEGRGDQPALIYDSAVTNSITTLSLRERWRAWVSAKAIA